MNIYLYVKIQNKKGHSLVCFVFFLMGGDVVLSYV